MKYRHFINIAITCIVGTTMATVTAQRPNVVPENKYGLNVISTREAYQVTLKADSNNRMVPLKSYLTPLLTQWQYATKNNFTGAVLYTRPEAIVRLPVAKALAQVQSTLKQQGLSLLFFDAYRPYSVTEKMWEIVPDERYAANPAKGSGHNRGIAVDVTLASLKTGKPLPMPTAFDDFTEKAHHNYTQVDSIISANRALLKTVMEQHGFKTLSTEWWHYQFNLPSVNFALLDLPFSAFIK